MTHFVYHCDTCNQQFTVQHPATNTAAAHSVCTHCGSAGAHLVTTASSPRAFTTVPEPVSGSKQAKARQPRQPRRHKAY